jgi:putative peptide zinc metalloprotease protein
MYGPESLVAVFPFTRQQDGGEVIIGRPDHGVFLALPEDAVEVLDWLAAGDSVGEAEERYRQKYGVAADLPDLLELLEGKGLVRPRTVAADAAGAGEGWDGSGREGRRFHFEHVPEALARRVFGRPALVAAGVVVALALVAIALDPAAVPGRSALYFPRHRTLYALVLLVLSYFTLFAHEFGHLLAGRALGVSSRMGIGHRLWIVVAETDLTGLWAVPRQDRYLPLLAGAILDAVSAALLILASAAVDGGWLLLPDGLVRLVRAMIFVYLMRLLWQCFFFVRTDFYFVLANYLSCKNLLGDTETYLRNRLARLTRRIAAVDQSHIPPREMRFVRLYAWVWIAGRLLALGLLVFVTIPVGIRYFHALAATIAAGYRGNRYAYVDAMVIVCLTLIPLAIGTTMWVASLSRRLRRSW